MSSNLLQCFGHCTCDGQKNTAASIPIADKAFESLSPDEQDRVHRDLYGIEEPIEESPEFISKKLADLDKKVGLFGEGIKKHYLRAVDIEKKNQQQSGNINHDYITNPKFRLMFLRAERFDTQKAARRLVRYFTEKFELFGEDKLACRIKQEDFNQYNDSHALLTGGISFVGAKDRAGRSIIMVRPEQIFKEQVISMKRMYMYTFQEVLENDEVTQRKGVVMLAYNMNAPKFRRATDVISVLPILRMAIFALPFRVAGAHFCYNDFKDHFILNLGLVVHTKDNRARFRLHYQSTHLECMLDLRPYGIPTDSLPLTEEGDFRHDMLWEYLQRWRQLEE